MRITLCGSTKFPKTWALANRLLTLDGHFVYTIAFAGSKLTEDQKRKLDAIHMAKIVDSDAILVLNVDGYMGYSTRQEIEFAIAMNRRVYFLTPAETLPDYPQGMDFDSLYKGVIPKALAKIIDTGKE